MLTGYDDVQLIGEGGLGKVYRARRISTGGLVAIKELRDVEEASPAWHRARRELDALLRLKGHPYVINVEEVAQGPSGPCLVMEYAPNGSLLDRMASQPFTGPELILIGQQVCDALSAAHKLGIVHRDIKPHNLLIGSFGQVKVCDFGIAQLARDGEANTKTSAITMAYASPEEIDGDGQVGPAADVYSFGATMLHLITGKRPTFKNRMDTGTIDLSAADPALAPVLGLLRQSMAHEPEDRPSIDDLVAGFDESAAGLTTGRARSLLVASMPTSPEVTASQLPKDEDYVGPTIVRRSDRPVTAEVPGADELARHVDEELTVLRQRPSVNSIEGRVAPRSKRSKPKLIIAGAAIVAVLAAIAVVYFGTRDSSEYKPGPVAQSMLDSLEASGINVQLTNDELQCIDSEGKGIDPELIKNGSLDTMDPSTDPELAAFAGKVYDKCFERSSRIALFADGMVADGSGTEEQATCAATALDDAVMEAGGYEALLGDQGGEQLMNNVFTLMGSMAECGIDIMGN